MDIIQHNSRAWDREVELGNGATVPVSPQDIAEARKGNWRLQMSSDKRLPKEWMGDIHNKNILCLAAGGGQQGPLLSAAGANVVVFDNSPAQLAQDAKVAARENLNMRLEQGDMRDLSIFDDNAFDIIYLGFANHFIEELSQVWKECYRVLCKGGILISTFWNPINYLFDYDEWDQNNNLVIRYSIPYSDLTQLPKEQLASHICTHEPLEFGHTLESQIGGQIAAGFLIAGFIEDSLENDILSEYMNTVITTRALKLML
jgi:SAM-dependent methyltransferase